MPRISCFLLTGACVVICTLMFHASVYAQQAVLSCGGNVSDVGGSVSFSLGQVAYTAVSDSGGSLNQGVQHTHEACLGDINNDGVISTPDLLVLISEFGCLSACASDLNGDGAVNTTDLLILIGVFGTTCSP